MSMIKIFKGKEKIQLDQLHILQHSFWIQKHSVQCIWYGSSIWHPQLEWHGTKCLLHDIAQKLKGWCQNRCHSGLWEAKSCTRNSTLEDVRKEISLLKKTGLIYTERSAESSTMFSYPGKCKGQDRTSAPTRFYPMQPY